MKNINKALGILTVFLAFGQVQAQNWVTNGLVAYYPFNGNVNDESGNGYNGVMTGSDWKFSSDRLSGTNSLNLNANTSFYYWHDTGAYMSVPRSVDFNKDYTLTLWVNVSSKETRAFPENLISNGADSESGVNLRLLANWSAGSDTLQFMAGGNSSVNVTIPAVRDDWWQISVVHSGTNVSIYKDGELLTSGILGEAVNTPEIRFGSHLNGFSYPFTGGIDDVRIYDSALTASQVKDLYQSVPKPSVPEGLVAYYTFDGNVNDESGYNNNGAMVGTAWEFAADRFNQTNSLYLNAGGSYMIAPRSVDFNKDYTLSAWVNVASGVSGFCPENFISNGADSDSGINLRLLANWSTNKDLLQFMAGANSSLDIPVTRTRDTWWQISVVHSGTNVSIYGNGKFLTNGVIATPKNTAEIWFGRHMNGLDYSLQGGIDDVRIYNCALSTSEIQQVYRYESGLSRLTVTPANLSVIAGNSANFFCRIGKDISGGLQWYLDGKPLTNVAGQVQGAQAPILTLASVKAEQSGDYYLVVSNKVLLVASTVGHLNVMTPPVILSQPNSITNISGTTATFSVEASGASLRYQWYRNGHALRGATQPTLTLTNVQTAHAGSFAVAIVNKAGLIASKRVTLTVLVAPKLVTQPANQKIKLGQKVVLTGSATGSAPLRYQWYFGSTPLSNVPGAITGATTSKLVLTSIKSEQLGNYYLRVENAAGSVSSRVAQILSSQPAITGTVTEVRLIPTPPVTVSPMPRVPTSTLGAESRFPSPVANPVVPASPETSLELNGYEPATLVPPVKRR